MVFKLYSDKDKKEKGNILVEPGMPESQTADAAEFSQSKFYGVRSYLHQFYASPTNERPPPGVDQWYLLPPPTQQNRCAIYICRAASAIGLILLLAGGALLLISYVSPRWDIKDALDTIDKQWGHDGSIYVRRDTLLRLYRLMNDDPFRLCRLVGLSLLLAGGVLLVLSLSLPAMCACVCDNQPRGWSELDASPHEPPVRVFTAAEQRDAASPIEKASCDVTKVQPSESVGGKGGADSVLLSEGEKPILQ